VLDKAYPQMLIDFLKVAVLEVEKVRAEQMRQR